jgi:4-amino-4-deoxy-L-arabinose transferase-like glycosyltransferase
MPDRWRHLAGFLTVAFLAGGVRFGVRVARGDATFWEQSYGFYFDLAQKLVREHTFCLDALTCAYWTPLYPAFLALVTGGERNFLSIAAAQSAVGVVTVWCAYHLARLWFSAPAGWLAAVGTALYPYFVVHDTALQETGLYTATVALATLALALVSVSSHPLRQALLAGGLTGVAILVRPSLVPIAPLALGWLWWSCQSTSPSRRWPVVGSYVLALLLVLLPWLARNWLVVGRPVLTTRLGHSLWIANNPQTFTHYPVESIDRSTAAAWAAMTPAELAEVERATRRETDLEDWFRARAWAYIRSHPGATAWGACRKLGAAFWWQLNPVKGRMEQLIYGVSYVPVMLLAGVGLWLLGRRKNWPALLLCVAHVLAFSVVTAVFWAHTSHRSYLDVYFIILAAGALASFRRPDARPLLSWK